MNHLEKQFSHLDIVTVISFIKKEFEILFGPDEIRNDALESVAKLLVQNVKKTTV